MIVELKLLPLHPAQQRIMQEKRRYNVLKCGRKFGKTTLCEELITDKIIEGLPVAYYSPTYKDLHHVWDRVKYVLRDVMIAKDESLHELQVVGGGKLEMWSLDNVDAGRSREYARIIIDEAEYVKDLKTSWEATIRATLAYYQGDAWFLSTPKFGQTYFKELAKKVDPQWQSWTFSTLDNPHIPPEEVEAARASVDEMVFRCEYMAEDITLAVNKFIYTFDRKKHVAPDIQPVDGLPVILSFDFNVEPITCMCGQVADGLEWVRIFKEYRLLNSDIEEICHRIATDFPYAMLMVTGDASGQNRTALKRDLNYYKVIQRILRLGMGQFRVPPSNPPLKNSRVLCNALLAKHPDYLISDRCPYLINDIESVEVDSEGDIDKGKDKHKSHLLDGWRYFNNAFLSKFLDLRIYD